MHYVYKAGAFITDELDMNQLGVDTTNNRLYIPYEDGTVKYTALT